MEQRNRQGGAGPFREILDVARLLRFSLVPEKAVETVLMQLCERIGKRARCALLEGDDLRLRFCAGHHSCPIDGVTIHRKSVVWDAVNKGKPVNIENRSQAESFTHTLSDPITVKAVIPLGYVDPLTNERKKVGALIVDSGQEGAPISSEDFEYLQVIGHLISAIFERTDLVQQLMATCNRQESILMETAHNFRNSIAIIAGFARRITKSAGDGELKEDALRLSKAVRTLEAHVRRFEKHMSLNV